MGCFTFIMMMKAEGTTKSLILETCGFCMRAFKQSPYQMVCTLWSDYSYVSARGFAMGLVICRGAVSTFGTTTRRDPELSRKGLQFRLGQHTFVTRENHFSVLDDEAGFTGETNCLQPFPPSQVPAGEAVPIEVP